jgi:hypothetical protein
LFDRLPLLIGERDRRNIVRVRDRDRRLPLRHDNHHSTADARLTGAGQAARLRDAIAVLAEPFPVKGHVCRNYFKPPAAQKAICHIVVARQHTPVARTCCSEPNLCFAANLAQGSWSCSVHGKPGASANGSGVDLDDCKAKFKAAWAGIRAALS